MEAETGVSGKMRYLNHRQISIIPGDMLLLFTAKDN